VSRGWTARGFLALAAVGDLALAAGSLYLAFAVRLQLALPFTAALLPRDRLRFFEQEWPLALALQLVALYLFGFYDLPRPLARSELARRLAGATLLLGGALTAYHFLSGLAFPRSVLVLFLVLDGVAVGGWRLLLQRAYRAPRRRVALVGSGPAARELAASIAEHHWHGLSVAGWVPAPGEPAAAAPADPALGPCLGEIGDLPRRLAAGEFDDVILASGAPSWQTTLVSGLAEARATRPSVLLVPGPFESLIGRLRYRWVHDIPLVEVVREGEWTIRRPLKRGLDLVGATLLLLPALPVMAACAAFIELTSRGGVFYRQVRVGRNRRPFRLIKLRTMRPDAEPQGEVLAQHGDPRLIRGGAVLRRLRLDELPQLFNVLGGSMSLVGPRPERPGFVERYLREVPGYAERFAVAPGVTGLAQVNGDYHSSAQNKLRYDLAYIANWSLWLDLSILFRTIKIVLTSRGV